VKNWRPSGLATKAIVSNRMEKLKIFIVSIIALNLLTSCDWHFGVNGWTPPKPPYNPMPAPTSILDAAKDGDIEAVRLFLANGSNVNARNGQNRTPLHMAAWLGHKEIASLLIMNGAVVDSRDNFNSTPLHKAAYDHEEILVLLIDKSADINAKDINGNTPLHNASIKGHIKIVEILVGKGANVNAKTDNGRTPLDFTNGDIADLLRKHGAKMGEELKAEGK